MIASRNFKYWLIPYFLALLIVFFQSGETLRKDSYDYAKLAQSLAAGEGLEVDGKAHVLHPPGYPALVAAAFLATGNIELSGRMVSFGAFALALLLFFLLIQKLFPPETQFYAFLLFALNGFLLIAAFRAMSESLFLFMLLGLVHAAVKIREPGGRSPGVLAGYFFGFGILGGMTYLVRPEGFLAAIAIGVFALIGISVVRTKRIAFFVVMLAGMIAVSSPYLVFLHDATGSWQFSGKTYPNLIMGELESPYQTGTSSDSDRYRILEKVKQDPTQTGTLWTYLEEQPVKLVARLPANFTRMNELLAAAFSLLGVFFILLGVVISRKEQWILLVPLVVLPAYLFFFFNLRILSPFFAFLIPWMASGLETSNTFLKTRLRFYPRYRRLAVGASFLILMLYSVKSFVSFALDLF